MEKKSGNLDLKGRRAGTAPVLSENLAILVREELTLFFWVMGFNTYYLIPFHFNGLATPASPSSISSSSILDAILFTWPAWNIVKHSIHAMWRSFIAFPSTVSDSNWRSYKRHFVDYKRRRRCRRRGRRESIWSMDCWWRRIRYGEERWERIFRWWWIVIRPFVPFDPFPFSNWLYER